MPGSARAGAPLAHSPSAPPAPVPRRAAPAAAPAAAVLAVAGRPAPGADPWRCRSGREASPCAKAHAPQVAAHPCPLKRSPSAPPAPALGTLRPSFVAAAGGGGGGGGASSRADGEAAAASRGSARRCTGDRGGAAADDALPLVGASRGYRTVGCVGRGSFGRALLVQDARGSHFVLKAVSLARSSSTGRQHQVLVLEARREASVMAKLRHPYVIRYREHFEECGTLAIVMDFARGGNLLQRIRATRLAGDALAEAQVLRWFTQVVVGFKYVHGTGLIHRDAKSENFLLSAHGDVLIGDFGLAMHIGSSSFYDDKAVGTPYYLSPEIIQRGRYSGASDIWALGVCLFEMSALRVPFDAHNLAGLTVKITQGTIPQLPATYSSGLQLLAADLLCRDYRVRPAAAQLVKHPLVHATIQCLVAEARGEVAPAEPGPAAKDAVKPVPATGERAPASHQADPPASSPPARASSARASGDRRPAQRQALLRPAGPAAPAFAEAARKTAPPLPPFPQLDDGGHGHQTQVVDAEEELAATQPLDDQAAAVDSAERQDPGQATSPKPSAKSRAARRRLPQAAAGALKLPPHGQDAQLPAAPLAPRGPRPTSLPPPAAAAGAAGGSGRRCLGLAPPAADATSARRAGAAWQAAAQAAAVGGGPVRGLPLQRQQLPGGGASARGCSSASAREPRPPRWPLPRSQSVGPAVASARPAVHGGGHAARPASAERVAAARRQESGSPGPPPLPQQLRQHLRPQGDLQEAPRTAREKGPLRLVAGHVASARRLLRY